MQENIFENESLKNNCYADKLAETIKTIKDYLESHMHLFGPFWVLLDDIFIYNSPRSHSCIPSNLLHFRIIESFVHHPERIIYHYYFQQHQKSLNFINVQFSGS